MAASIHGMGMGWHPDLPDFRDYTQEADAIKVVLVKSGPLKTAARKQPSSIDLRKWCSPVEDQKDLGSCTANAGVGMYEYFERRASGKHIDASRLFLYKVTRDILGRLDPSGTSPANALAAIRKSLAAGLACMFGFSVYSSMPAPGDGRGEIPMPGPGDTLEGGHAILAVGYDDNRKIGKNKGAFLIRNSWGTGWGDQGYGWLPYAYVEGGLADDFWSMVKAEFVDTDLFK